jgi:threonine dehydratase
VAHAGRLGDALERSGSPRFATTPLVASRALATELGCSAPVWVKDETANVAGSHKARHLASILLYLLATESTLGRRRERLAIASCGNAALAAATLAAAVDWPLTVFVPTWMDDGFGRELDRLGVDVVRCARRDDDPPGDPTLHRFRAAVADGAIPFTVQGPENALCLDGGRTLGWEIGEQLLADDGAAAQQGQPPAARDPQPTRAFVQVGGGALATCVGLGLRRTHPHLRIDPVQAAGCAPFARAMHRVGATASPADLAARWGEVMEPWPNPQSIADGILDDETYDWLGVATAMLGARPGTPIVVPEPLFAPAVEHCRAAGFDPSPTGAAGVAGVLAACADGTLVDDTVLVVLSGVAR